MAFKHVLGAARTPAGSGTPKSKKLRQGKAQRIKLSGARPPGGGVAGGFGVKGQPRG